VVMSWYQKVREFKSPVYVVAAMLLRSRETQVAINQRLQEEIAELKERLEQQAQREQRQKLEVDTLRKQVAGLQEELQEAKQSVNLPEDPPIGPHGYGANRIELATNLARAIGFRPAARAIALLFKWLKVAQKTPTRNSIRNWLQRQGIAELKRPLGPNEDLVIMVDHSMQIGTEKVMVALGVNRSELPESGKALTHEYVRVLEVKPGSQWKTENMEQAYEALANRHGGAPRAVLIDGAPELRDGAKCLETQRKDTIVLRDFKHYAANVLKSLLGKDERFQEVSGKIGKTRSAVQQTELAHLNPPRPKPKARFMNLSPKLGWVVEYEEDIGVWQECQDVVSRSLTFINKQYLFQGAADGLRSVIGDSLEHDKSKELAKRLIDFVQDAE